MIIDITKLLAANVFASTEETRYYLNGVLYEVKDGKARFVATDGHRMIIFDLGDGYGEDLSFIIPSSLIKRIKADKYEENGEININGDTIKIDYNDTGYIEKAIDGPYPEYRRVMIPDDKEQIHTPEIRFNPSYLGDFAKVNKILGYKNVGIIISLYGESEPVKITTGRPDTYTAILMPMRA